MPHRMLKVVTAGLVFLAAGSQALWAAPAGVGAKTEVGIYSAYDNGGFGAPGGGQFDGGEGAVSSYVFFSTGGMGVTEAQATLSGGPTATPATLRAQVVLTGDHPISGPFGTIIGASGSAEAFVSEKFKYTGTLAHTETVTFTLDYSARIDFEVLDYLFAEVAALSDTGYFFSSNIGTIVGEGGGSLLQNLGVNARNSIYITGDDGTLRSVNLAITFDLQPGQEFFLFQKLSVGAMLLDDYVDAFNTLTGQFANPELFVSLNEVNVVPSPATAAMLLPLALLAFGRRRA